MKLNLKAKGMEWTPALKTFVEEKLGSLEKFVKRFDAEGVIKLEVEIARTTHHHIKGNVFRVDANLRLPKEVLRGEEEAEDLRVAIDRLHHTLELEIKKYKTKFVNRPRRESKKE